MVIVHRATSPAKALRLRWGRSLQEHLDASGTSRKELQLRLADIGIRVTPQAISQWIRGETAPRAEMQIAVAAVLKVPARSLFPLAAT